MREYKTVDFNTLTVDILKYLGHLFGNYGMAIIVLTIIIRMVMWPLSYSQQKSMRTMQALQPKMKLIQDRYKSDPQKMQQKMMEFYKENKFNPFAGCLPMLIQLPIFIVLYSALMSPQFIQAAGDAKFLFINRLDATLRGNAGVSYDGSFNATGRDIFVVTKNAKVYLTPQAPEAGKDAEEAVVENVKIQSPKTAIKVQGEISPGEPVDLKMSIDALDLRFSQLQNIEKAEVTVTNQNTREIEHLTLVRQGDNLIASVPTIKTENKIHYDVLFLVLFFGATMFITTKVMTATNKNVPQDAMQQAMQKSMGTMMPIMLMATFIFIPIPAGVLLYLVVSNAIQIVQTIVINKQLDKEDEKPKVEVITE